jgi:predicted nucleic acid-binding protein
MEISREVILDLLPLYIAGEVSEDSRKLVEEYLDQDEELRRLAERIEKSELKEIPMAEQTELSLDAYKKANKWMVLRTLGLALIISLSLMGLLAFGVLIANLGLFF